MFMVLVLFGVSVLVFSIMMLLPPGMRAGAYLTSERVAPDQIERLIAEYGLDDPAPVQYARWLSRVLRGDFGFSTTAEAGVLDGFASYFPVTLELVMYATPLIILVGVWLGTLSAVRRNTAVDHAVRVFSVAGYSLPTFWLGLLLLMFFYGFLGVLPPGTLSNEGKDIIFSEGFIRYTKLITVDAILNWRPGLFFDALYRLALPVFNLVVLSSALIMRLTRSNMLEALGQDYVRTAWAKGADRRTVYRKHVRKNALLPVITVSGAMFANLMGGMVITETIFSRKGIGWWMARAASQLDVSAIMFNVLFLGAVFVVVNLIVDVLYAAVDPRVRLA
jgi:peptide/nickel transport system permease protein